MHQVGELGAHTRVDLDDAYGIAALVVEELDVEQPVVEADLRQHPLGDRGHSPRDPRAQDRRVVEAPEAERAAVHDGVHDPDDTHRSALDEPLERHLMAFQYLLGPHVAAMVGEAQEAREQLIKRAYEGREMRTEAR